MAEGNLRDTRRRPEQFLGPELSWLYHLDKEVVKTPNLRLHVPDPVFSGEGSGFALCVRRNKIKRQKPSWFKRSLSGPEIIYADELRRLPTAEESIKQMWRRDELEGFTVKDVSEVVHAYAVVEPEGEWVRLDDSDSASSVDSL